MPEDAASMTATTTSSSHGFPCSLKISTPFPTSRLARIALRSLAVDKELSPLVQRSFSLASSSPLTTTTTTTRTSGDDNDDDDDDGAAAQNVLVTHYRATTNRMLRVAVNGFFESLGVVIGAMRELDVGVLGDEWKGWSNDDENNGSGGGGDAAAVAAAAEKDAEIRELRRVQGLEESGRLDYKAGADGG